MVALQPENIADSISSHRTTLTLLLPTIGAVNDDKLWPGRYSNEQIAIFNARQSSSYRTKLTDNSKYS